MTSLADVGDLILNWMVVYGAVALALALFIGGTGIPLPGTLLVIASGAFARQGLLDPFTTFALGLLGVVIGDTLCYSIGRLANRWVDRRFAHTETWRSATAQFERRGGLAIYLTRWLLTPLAIPVNLVAGTSGYRLWRFVSFDVAGETTWLLVYGGLGYLFGSQWEAVSTFISDFSGLLLGIVVVLGGVWFLLKPGGPAHRSGTQK